MKQTYYVRVVQTDAGVLERYMELNGYAFRHLSNDFGPGYVGTSLYSVKMDSVDELSLRLSIPIKGCMNFVKTLDNLASRVKIA